jgi:clan AA aspartic protease
MILGSVINLEAVIQIEIIGQDGTVQALSAVVDTGYNGHITLPKALINSLGLLSSGKLRGMLADGTIISMNTYLAEVVWFDSLRRIVVTETEGGPLIGMALLEGSRLAIDVVEGGKIEINSLN